MGGIFSYERMQERRENGNNDEAPPGEQQPDNTDVIKEKLLRRIRIYFCFSGQYWSFKGTAENAKRILSGLLQAMIVIFASLYFFYSFAIFGFNMKLDRLSLCFFYYPVSFIENAMWEFRWLATCLMGIVYTPGIWKELFEKDEEDEGISLNNDINIKWMKIRCFSRNLLALFFVMWLLSEFSILLEISSNFSETITGSEAWRFGLDAIAWLVDRLVAFPLFFLFCTTLYILCCMVEDYRDGIKKWKWSEGEAPVAGEGGEPPVAGEGGEPPVAGEGGEAPVAGEGNVAPVAGGGEAWVKAQKEESENSAREKFRRIKEAIRIAGLKFESFLTVHFVLLVCTLFLGICSCFEEFEKKIPMGNSTRTVLLPFQIPQSARFIDIDFHGINNIFDFGKTSTHLSQTRAEQAADKGKKAANETNNSPSSKEPFEESRNELVKRSTASALMLMIVRTIESLLLYMLPLGLMARLQNSLRRVYEVIEDCNLKDQKSYQYLFDDVEVIRRMCKYVKTAHGLRIYGYTLPTFGAFFLAAFAPFIKAIIQLLLCHINMQKG